MLRINAIADSAAAKAYYQSKNADYYLEGQEEPAYWHGYAALKLGLAGPVRIDDFHALCDNLHPARGYKLTAARGNRRVGYDFTFSVPKSVSVLYNLGGDPRLADEFRNAVSETMREVEAEMATRVRKGRQDVDRRTGNMVWADFLHKTTRPIKGQPDPQLHIHAVVFNLTWDDVEQEWKAGQFGDLKANAPYFQAVFRVRLANRLQALGYELDVKDGDFEIVGVPDRVVEEFSRRTSQIEKVARLLGITRPETKAKLGATTREAKKEGLTWDGLLELWGKRVTEKERTSVLDTVTRSIREPAPVPERRDSQSLNMAAWHAFERASVVPQRELVTHALRFGLGRVTPEGVLAEVGKDRDLIRRVVKGVEMVTTWEVLNEEEKVLDFARRARGKFRRLGKIGAKVPDSLTPGKDERPTTGQAAAMRHLWQSHDGIVLVRGLAGTGKSKMLRAALDQVNLPHVVLAPSAEASRGVLRREGFDNAETLAKFLVDQDMQQRAKGGLIVLDEASLAGARDVAKLAQLAESLNARLLLLGDRRQHKSVARGDILALLEDKAGLPVAEVSDIKRQAGEYRAAVKLASEGKTAEAFGKLDRLGWIREGADALVDDYMAAVRAGRSVLVVSPTHAEGDAISDAIRERLKQEGRLKGEERTFERLVPLHLTEAEKSRRECLPDDAVLQFVRNSGKHKAGERVALSVHLRDAHPARPDSYAAFRPDPVQLSPGDTIRITANGKTLDGKHRLNNGAQYEVAGFTEAGNIRLGNGWVIGKDFAHFTHGYVATSHAAQGKTVDRVLIAQSSQSFPASDKSQFYVSISRGRHSATVYTDDKDALLEAVNRDRPRMLATELVRKPRRGVRERLKRHLSFLRRVASLTHTPAHDLDRTSSREEIIGYDR